MIYISLFDTAIQRNGLIISTFHSRLMKQFRRYKLAVQKWWTGNGQPCVVLAVTHELESFRDNLSNSREPRPDFLNTRILPDVF